MLMKRLAMYSLRRALAITRDEALAVHWSASAPARPMIRALRRWAGAGWPRPMAPAWAVDEAWLAHRLALGVPEGADLADTLWLECNAVELNGVSFTKGCYGAGKHRPDELAAEGEPAAGGGAAGALGPDRRRVAYPAQGYAVDHLRVEDITPIWPRLVSPPRSQPS
jgi:hypothetical protein